MRRALAQTQLPVGLCAHGDAALVDVFGGCLSALGDAALVEVLVFDSRPSHKTISGQTPTDAYAPLYSLGAKALSLWGRAPKLHTPSGHVLAPRRKPITCDDGLFIGTNNADDRDGTYTRSEWGLPSPRLCLKSTT
jgi:hypothetical protein